MINTLMLKLKEKFIFLLRNSH